MAAVALRITRRDRPVAIARANRSIVTRSISACTMPVPLNLRECVAFVRHFDSSRREE
jgi:hypothetical protein